MPCKPPRGPTRPCLLISCLAGALASTACAARPPLVLTVPVADSLRAPCPRPAADAVRTAGDLAAFSIRQEAAIGLCEARRDAVLAVVDAHNAAAAGLKDGRGGAHSP